MIGSMLAANLSGPRPPSARFVSDLSYETHEGWLQKMQLITSDSV